MSKMKIFTTTIRAIDPKDGELKLWFGPNINAISFQDARKWCDNNDLGYCEILGELVAEIETEIDPNTDFNKISKLIDYSNDN